MSPLPSPVTAIVWVTAAEWYERLLEQARAFESYERLWEERATASQSLNASAHEDALAAFREVFGRTKTQS